MIGRAKHEFPQEAPAAPFKTVLLSELERALFAKRLHNRIIRDPPQVKVRPDWGSDRYVWARRRHHPLIQSAKRRAALEIRSDLETGLLIGYLPTETAGVFQRLPPQFWREPTSGIRVDGMLFDVAKGKPVPDQIDENTFCVFEECARAWLKQREIEEDNPAFPNSLRRGQPIVSSPPPSGQEILEQLLRFMQNDIARGTIGDQSPPSSLPDRHSPAVPMTNKVPPSASEINLSDQQLIDEIMERRAGGQQRDQICKELGAIAGPKGNQRVRGIYKDLNFGRGRRPKNTHSN
jgi:hypothetical protein